MRNFTFQKFIAPFLILSCSFTQLSLAQDTTPPTAVLDPLTGSGNVPLDKVFTVVFSELVQSTDDNLIANIFEPVSNGGFSTVADLSIANGTLTLIDDGTVSTLTIAPTAPLPQNKALRIAISPGHFEDLAGNDWVGTSPNGFGFDWQFTTEFGDTPCVSGNLDLEISFDGFAEETSWRVSNADGSAILASGTYTSTQSNTTIIEQITNLPDGTYQFTIEDSFGDGICCGQGNGRYSVTKNGIELFGGGQFGNRQSFIFCIDASVDSEVPVITCPDAISADAGSSCSTSVTLTDPTATDNVSSAFTFEGVRSDGRELTDTFFVGTTKITWTVTDEAGNVSEACEQLVTVTGTGDCWFDIGPDIVGGTENQLGAGVTINAEGNIIAYVNPNANGLGNVGEVTVLQRVGDTWNAIGNSVAGGQLGRGRSGIDLNDAGDRMAVSLDEGKVRVYQNVGGLWQLLGQEIPVAGLPFIQKLDFDASGDRLVVGYAGENLETGLAVIYELQNSNWVQLGQTLNGDSQGDFFGRDVNLNAAGTRVVVGAYQTSINQPGYVRVFELDNGNWVQLGDDIVGDSPGDFFGVSVGLNDEGNRLVVGANAGKYAKVFQFENGTWSQLGLNLAEFPLEQPGYQVDINGSGDRVLIGNFDQPGRIYQWVNTQWQLLGQPIYVGVGQDVAINKTGDVIIMGTPDFMEQSGKVGIFEYAGELAESTETLVILENGNLTITDTNGGDSDDEFILSVNGDNLRVQKIGNTISISGNGTQQIDANTVEIPLADITAGIVLEGGSGTNSLSLDTALSLSGAGNDLTVRHIDISLTGNGRLQLNGLNIYDGDFDTSGLITEIITTANFYNGSALIGTGGINGVVNMNAESVIAAGTSPGILNTGNLTLDSDADFEAEINGPTPGTEYDKVVVTGAVNLNGAFADFIGGYANTPEDIIALIDNDGEDPVVGIFADLSEGSTVVIGDFSGIISYEGGDGNDVVLMSAGEPIESDLIITEVMYDPLGSDTGWEWIEIYNGGEETLELDGFVFDDNTASSHSEPNITSGSLQPGQTAILFDGDEVSIQDFANVWGSELNLIPVTDWPTLGNTNGDSIGIWNSFESYDGDNQNQANTFARLVYQVGGDAWPGNLSGRSIFLTDLESDTSDGNNWASSVDGEEGAYKANEPRNEIGSPGVVPGIVEDTEPPVITCPENVTLTTEEGICEASLAVVDPTAVDNVSEVFEFVGIRSDNLELADPFPIGETSITWTATDEAGNTSESCTQLITVVDKEAPTVTCPADISTISNNGSPLVLEVGTASATDNCPAELQVAGTRSDNEALNEPYPVGTTTILWQTMDVAGNVGQCTQTITVIFEASMENDITGFEIPNQIGGTEIDPLEKTIVITMPFDTDVTALAPSEISVSAGATVFPEQGITQDFSQPVFYTVIAQDESTQQWSVSVELQDEPFRPFITTWKTDNPGDSDDNQITIPTFPGAFYDYTVDWGDGSFNEGVNGDITHTYETPGTYQVSISGEFPRINFKIPSQTDRGDNEKLVSINQWGDMSWTSMEGAFQYCRNLDVIANDSPDLSQVTSIAKMFLFCSDLVGNESFDSWDVSNVLNMQRMFLRTSKFNQEIGSWDVSNVTDMSVMFAASGFNQDISDWNVGNVRTMKEMFRDNTVFNMPIGNWDVSNVEDMGYMFLVARSFNQDISGWDVSKVANMISMFEVADNFNQPIGTWDVSNVISMGQMFQYAGSFNQNLSEWNVEQVRNMASMFFEARNFDQDLGGWEVSNVTNMSNMFEGVSLSTENYDNTLIGWSTQQLQSGVNFDGGNSQYCLGEAGRQKLIDDFGWTITDGGKSADCPADCTPTNLALNQTSSQSSLYGTGEALYANDGDLAGTVPWGANVNLQHTAVGEFQPWWQVDLGEVSQLERIDIYNRTNGLESRLNNFYVLTSEEAFLEGASLASLLGDENVTAVFFDGAAGLVENFPVEVKGR